MIRLIIVLLLLSSPAFAGDYYVAQAAAESGNGTDCSNADAIADVTWGAGNMVGPGDTLHLCGTITSQLVIGASGTDNTTNRITIKFESGSKFSKNTWGDSGAISCSNKDYILIDGNGVGIIENTDNGSSSGGYGNQTAAIAIDTEGCDYLEIKGLTIQTMYVHVYQSDDVMTGVSDGGAILAKESSNISIHDNTISNAYNAITHRNAKASATTHTNVSIYNNTMSACCWAIGVYGAADSGTSTTSNVSIYNNTITMGTNWDAGLGDDCHTNAMHIYADSPPRTVMMPNMKIYNNIIKGPSSNLATGSAGIRIAYLADGTDTSIYNNIFLANATYYPSEAWITFANTEETAPKIMNNTVIGYSSSSGYGCGVNYTATTGFNGVPNIRNNIFTLVDAGVNLDTNSGTPVMDYNIYYNYGSLAIINSNTYTLSTLRTFLGGCPNNDNECSGSTSDPALSSTGYPTLSSTAVINSGESLTSDFTTDRDGNTRGASWDIGAYEYWVFGGASNPKKIMGVDAEDVGKITGKTK